MREQLPDNSATGRTRRLAVCLAADPCAPLEHLATLEGMPPAELSAFMAEHRDELRTEVARARADGAAIKPVASRIILAGLERLGRELPDAELEEVIEILKVAKNTKEAEVREELAQADDGDKLPMIYVNFGRSGMALAVKEPEVVDVQMSTPGRTLPVVEEQADEAPAVRARKPRRAALLEGFEPDERADRE